MHLTEVIKRRPELRLQLAVLAKSQGDLETMNVNVKTAEAVFTERLKNNPVDHEARLGLAESQSLQGKFADAKATIGLGASLSNSEELLRAYARRLASVLVQWCDAKQKEPKATVVERLELLDEALRLDPQSPEPFDRSFKLAAERKKDSEPDRESTKSAIEQRPTALGHLYLGAVSWNMEKAEEARVHWDKAFELSNGSPMIANNLAWTVAFTPPTDLPRALELAEIANRGFPNEPRFRSTRGHILAKLQRYQEALPDLQEGLRVYRDDPKQYSALAETCAKLGQEQQAAEYKKKAEELLAREKQKPVTSKR
jgi:tetratricopeptide (TPR) repeat protein